jgi:UDP-N-acetylglucosamine 2-epimerase (non-hydrolysing)/GDP/UDP-N,N'-diacetylbacillosamine 2-epimerase (hydrolysing)
MSRHPEIDLRLIVFGPHLSPEFGHTIQSIEQDGFAIEARIECLLSSDTDVGMAKTIGLATLSLADCLGQLRPDLLLLIADRYEMLAPASVALALRIPVAHIEGGEISEGAIDDAVRNALTKLSHVHFTSTSHARARVIAMGEEAWRVHCIGAPSLDHLRHSKLKTREKLEKDLGIDLRVPPILVAYHPTTITRDTTCETDALYEALGRLSGPFVSCYPNADAGSRFLLDRARRFLETYRDGRLFTNLDPISYWSLLRFAELLLGNSSSGIMEAASFGVPAIDIGIRQRGRERGRNVLHAEATAGSIVEQIEAARNPQFRRSLEGMENPYGDGEAGKRMTEVIASLAIDQELFIKRAD